MSPRVELAKYYMAPLPDHYILPSNESERERLYAQHHHVLKPLFGGTLIHPTVSLKPGDKILDCGTGSAVWVLDLVGSIPSTVVVYGFDIQPRLFPKELPDNIQLSVTNVTSLPLEWNNTFILVHQRLLMGGLRRDEWSSALNEMYRVVVPGGWVELCECDSWAAGPLVEHERSLMKALFDSKGLIFDCCRVIPSMLTSAGFTDVHVIEKQLSLFGEEGTHDRLNSIGVFRAMKAPIMAQGGLGHVDSEEEFDRLVDTVGQEMEITRHSVKRYTIFYAQKPFATATM